MRKLTLLLLLFFVSTVSAFSGVKPPLGRQLNRLHTKGLVGCWLMNEGSGNIIQDLSGNGQTGTFGASAPTWTSGKFGSALTFASGNNVVIVDKANPITAVTCLAWVKTTNNAINTILNWNCTAALTDGIWFTVDPDIGSGNARLYFYAGGVGLHNGTIPDLLDNLYHQLAVTYDGTTIRYYFDGIEVDSDSETGTFTFAGTNSYIGITDGGGQPTIGDIDHVGMWNRALSTSEIAQLYREPFAILKPSFEMFLFGGIAVPTVGGQVIFVNIN